MIFLSFERHSCPIYIPLVWKLLELSRLFYKILEKNDRTLLATQYDQSRETDEINILLVSHHLIVKTNQIDLDEKIESSEMVHHSRIRSRLSEERRLSDSIEKFEKYSPRIGVHASHQNEV